jgi:hypothetical protein
MSAIKNGAYTIELKGEEYALLFSLNAMDAVQERYGGYDKIAEALRTDNPNSMKEIRWLLTMLINEGILAEDENALQLTETQVGRMVHTGNLRDVTAAIYASFAKGTSGGQTETEEYKEKEQEEEENEGETKAVQEK